MTARTIELDFGTTLAVGAANKGKRKIDNISGAAFDGCHLWTGADEGTSFERLERTRARGFGKARSFDLADFFAGYPPEGEDEADLESLAFDGSRLWMIGSHALVRKNPERLRVKKLLSNKGVDRQAARTLLGFVEIDETGLPKPKSGHALPIGLEAGGLLAEMGRDWGGLARAIGRPAKENGLDIEGLAVHGSRIFVGLRGPVIGPYAIVLELEIDTSGKRLRIERRNGLAIRPHMIDTGGLGIRDLAWHPRGLVVLAGPTLDMEGPFEVYLAPSVLEEWSGEPGPTRTPRLQFEIAIDRTADAARRLRGRRPEAITLMDDGLLVIAERDPRTCAVGDGILTADLLPLPDLL